MELWKCIEGFEDEYLVSTYGRVKSLKGREPRILKPGTTRDGYQFVVLSKNNRGLQKTLHRLVACAFLEKTGKEVNHKDEDKSNNHMDNLEWCDRQYNVSYSQARAISLQFEGKPLQVKNISKFLRETGIDRGNFYKMLKGMKGYESCKGYSMGVNMAQVIESFSGGSHNAQIEEYKGHYYVTVEDYGIKTTQSYPSLKEARAVYQTEVERILWEL